MNANNLNAIERTIYEAARAETLADRWRIDAEVSERRREAAGNAREYQRRYEAEAADRWRQLATLKAQTPALEGE